MTPNRPERLRHTLVRFLSVRSAYNPAFTHDDRCLVYVSDSTGVPQVWTKAIEEGFSSQQLSHFEDRVGQVATARHHDRFVFTKDHGGNEHFQLFMMEDGGAELTQLTADPDAIHEFGGWSPGEDQLLFSSNARDRAFFDVHTMDLVTGRTEPVHTSDHTNMAADWSPDGRNVLFRRDYASFNHDLFLVSLEDHEARRITEHKGEAQFKQAQFGKNGREVYVITDQGREFKALAILDVEDPKPHFLLAGRWDVEEMSLSVDKKRMAYTRNVDGTSKLMIWEMSGRPTVVDMPRGVISGPSWSRRGRLLAFSFSGARHNEDIWVHDLDRGTTSRFTQSSTSNIDLSRFRQPRLFRYKSFDGLRVSAYIYGEIGEEAVPPTVVYIHGGPEGQFLPGFNPVVQFLASVGLSVVAPNVRGSSGYGRNYTHLDDVELRMDSVRDIERLVSSLKKSGVAGQRLAVIGGSYGGFMVLACMYKYPDLWTAGVDIVGISNFVTFLKNTGPWRRRLRAMEYGDPERDRAFLERISPLNNADKIKAPLLMIHGKNDPRVPFQETKQIEAVLKKMRREVAVLSYDDEGHGLIKLKNRITGYTAAAEFLLEHLAEG